ncbi:MAG: hypothetical protein OXD30_01850 [Bryobacterales bacterium]|nr:hypothetical protein [Bryobacterales bacterium]
MSQNLGRQVRTTHDLVPLPVTTVLCMVVVVAQAETERRMDGEESDALAHMSGSMAGIVG